jgi:PST family polysaccharide transporter
MTNDGCACASISRSTVLEGSCVAESSGAIDAADALNPAAKDGRPRPARLESYGKKAKVGALWTMGQESVTQLIGLPTTIILARLLTPEDFGIAAAAFFFIQLGKRIGNMGLNAALVRMKDVREEHRASVFVVNMVFGLVAWATLMLLAPSIGALYDDERVIGAVRVASTIFLVNFFGAVEFAVLQREMRFKEMALCVWTAPLVFLPISVTMAWNGWGYWSLLIAQLVSNMALTGSKVYFGRWPLSLAVTRRGLAETLPFGAGVFAKRLLTYAAENLDSLVVGGLFGVTSLGLYDKAFNAASNLSSRLALGSNVMFRIFALIQEDRDRFVRAYRKVVLTGTIVTLPLFAGLIVAAREFIVVLFGQQWLPAVVPFQLLCASGALRLVTAYASAAVQVSGRIWGEVSRKAAQVVLIVCLIFAFRPWGIQGAALAVFLAALFLTLLMQELAKRIVGLSWREMIAALRPSLIAAAGSATLIWAVSRTTTHLEPGVPDWLLLVMQVSVGGLFWAAFVLFVRFHNLQEVVDEALDEVVPEIVRRHIDRIRPRQIRTTPAQG